MDDLGLGIPKKLKSLWIQSVDYIYKTAQAHQVALWVGHATHVIQCDSVILCS